MRKTGRWKEKWRENKPHVTHCGGAAGGKPFGTRTLSVVSNHDDKQKRISKLRRKSQRGEPARKAGKESWEGKPTRKARTERFLYRCYSKLTIHMVRCTVGMPVRRPAKPSDVHPFSLVVGLRLDFISTSDSTSDSTSSLTSSSTSTSASVCAALTTLKVAMLAR